MFGSQVLETAIGIVFVFLAVSLIVSAIQEAIASLLKLRALTLRSGLKEMLADANSGLAFFEAVIRHPVVASANARPSYVSAQQFSTAIMDILGGSGILPSSVKSLRIAAQNLPEGQFRTVLQSLFREGEADLTGFEARLQHWFDQSMDRLSGVYKRWSQVLSFVIGGVLALVFQINALAVIFVLWTEEALRSQVNAQVADYLKQGGGTGINGLQTPLAKFGFSPIWEGPPITHDFTWFAGCFITAFAVMLGAPFWFGTLQSLVNIRGTGPAPAKASPEPGK
jgi:hypothetical protein